MEKTELTNAQKQNQVRQRITQAYVDPDKYEYFPAKEQNDHVKADQYQRVAIYARVSTDNPMQTTSFELQQIIRVILRCTVFFSASLRRTLRKSTTLRAKREMFFTIIKSIFPASHLPASH